MAPPARSDLERTCTWLIQHGYATGHGVTIEEVLGELEWQARERGAKAVAKAWVRDKKRTPEERLLVEFFRRESDGQKRN